MRTPAERFHPGEILREELEERRWSYKHFAALSGLPPLVVRLVLAGRHHISRGEARAIGKALGTSAEFWTNLQAAWDGAGEGAGDDVPDA